MSCGGCRHADFEKIHSAFLTHYSKDPKLGESRYAVWVKFSGLDETQVIYLQGAALANKSKLSFEWANIFLQLSKKITMPITNMCKTLISKDGNKQF